jgi:membrane protease YdiL (CAAX protease family)
MSPEFPILSLVTSSGIEIEASETEEVFKTLFHRPETLTGMTFLFLGCILNGFAEELVMRGYFLERLEFLLGSTPKSILFSSIVFCSYHIYQGVLGTFHVFIFGVIYGIFYCKYRRIWPLVIAHALQNIVSFGFMPN